jgi:hypothetical protein
MSSNNEEVDDFLDVDSNIHGQQYCVLSFLSPENVLKKKEVYFNSEFLKWLCDQSEYLEHSLLKGDKTKLNYNSVKEKYDDFIFAHEERLENEFHALENFRTTVRGIKVRGVYATQREAEVRCKVLQRLHKRDNVFLGQVGYWLPWDPSPERIENTEYLEPELNNLMKQYKENAAKRDIYYQEQKENQLKERVKHKMNEEGGAAASEATNEEIFEKDDPWLNNKEDKTKTD